jgi:phage shock protein PspC (stress-responsive transcriptional regulator)
MSTAPEQAPREAALFRTIREWGITRGDHGVIGGVVEGLGDRVGMARVPARFIVVIAAIVLNGFVLLAYAAAWALLPDKRGNIIVQNFGRGIPNVGALVGIAILTLFGLGGFDHTSGISFNNLPWGAVTNWGPARVVAVIFAVLVPMLVIGGIVTLIVVLVKRSNSTPPGGAPGATGSSPVFAAPPTSAAAYASPPAATSAPSTAPAATSPIQGPVAATMPAPYAAPPAARHYTPAPPAPPRPPRIPGPGRAFYLMSLAWAAIAAAAAVWMDRTDHLAVHPLIAGSVIFATGLGVIAVLVSLAGRKLGFLGFLAIASLVPLLIIAANAEGFRTAYADHGGITSNSDIIVTVDKSPPLAFDPTLAFNGLYSNVLFNGSCYKNHWTDSSAASVQRMNLASTSTTPAENTSVDITAEVTYLSIAQGTSVTLEGGPNASATVVFADRGFQCDFQTGSAPYMQLTKAGAPVINLVVKDDQYANTIVIQEVAS